MIIGNINRAISIQGEVIAKRGLKGEQGNQGPQGEKGDKGDKGDAGTTSWNGITDKPDTFPPSSHNHNDIYYTETEIDTLLDGKAPTNHNHNTLYYGKSEVYNKTETDSAISNHHDSSKADASTTYTKSEVDSAISGHHDSTKADVGVSYTKAEEDALLDDKADAEDIPTKTSELTNDSGFIDSSYHDNTKVDKVEGKGLSTNDYDDTEKGKVASAVQPSAIADMATQTWVGQQGFLTSHQDISGKADKRAIKTVMDAVAVANADYFLGTQSTVAITLPSTPATGDMISVVFYSGSTATTLTVSGSTIGTVPTPTANQRVEMSFQYDGTMWAVLSSVMAVS